MNGTSNVRWSVLLVVAAAISWLGLFVHNVADLPGQTVFSPESLLPLVLTAMLVAAWFGRARRFAAWALLAWGLLQLIGGGILSVLPLPVLPFVPAQSLEHYLFHALYSATQLPLILVAIVWLRRNRARPNEVPH